LQRCKTDFRQALMLMNFVPDDKYANFIAVHYQVNEIEQTFYVEQMFPDISLICFNFASEDIQSRMEALNNL
jgi:hypothetical protein